MLIGRKQEILWRRGRSHRVKKPSQVPLLDLSHAHPSHPNLWPVLDQLDRSPAATLPSDHYHHGDGTRHGLGKQDHPLGQTWQTVGAFFLPRLHWTTASLQPFSSNLALLQYDSSPSTALVVIPYHALLQPYYSATISLSPPMLYTDSLFTDVVLHHQQPGGCLLPLLDFAWVRIPPLCPHNPPLLPAAQHQCGVPEVPVHPHIGGASEAPHHLHLGGVKPKEE